MEDKRTDLATHDNGLPGRPPPPRPAKARALSMQYGPLSIPPRLSPRPARAMAGQSLVQGPKLPKIHSRDTTAGPGSARN